MKKKINDITLYSIAALAFMFITGVLFSPVIIAYHKQAYILSAALFTLSGTAFVHLLTLNYD